MNAKSALATNLRQRRLLITLLASTLTVAALLLSYQIGSSYAEALREAETKTRNYAAIIEARLDATLRSTDSILQTAVHELQETGISEPASALVRRDAIAAIDRELIDFVQLTGLRVYAANGDLLYYSASKRTPRSNVADRRYFLKLHDDPKAQLVFSEVCPITATGGESVVAARAWRDGRGSLLGVVIAVIELDPFSELFRSLDLGEGGVVEIRRKDDFSAVVRWPKLEREVNQPLPSDDPVREAILAGKLAGTLELHTPSDGVDRIYSYRSVDRYPFYVSAALSRQAALAGWFGRSLVVGGSGVLLLLLLAGLLIRYWRMQVREASAISALETSEERLRLALAASHQGLYDLNVQTGEIIVNPQYARMLGYDPDQFQETSAACAERMHPEDRERVARLYSDYIAGNVVEYRAEFRQRTRDGHYKWILSIGKVVERNEQFQPLRMLGTRLDISERKQSENALKNLNAELEFRVQQRTFELVYARNEAERASRAKSQFLSSMSHELRTPLNAILGFGQLLEADPEHVLPDKQQRYVREVMRAGKHLLELIDDLLDTARIEAGVQEVRLEPVHVSALLDECLSLIEPAAHERGIKLPPMAPPSCDCFVAADRIRLKQVMLNLLSNAVKYNRQGGTVQLDCASDGNALRISITDSGHGLDPEQQGRMFTSVERLGAERTPIKGAGIGLALSKQLVEMMDGAVGVHSEVGVGSTFWVRLARAARLPQSEESPLQPVAPRTVRQDVRTVLYIEDDEVNARLMESVFAAQPGLRLTTAALPALGLEMAHAVCPALILLDIQLPGMDGYEVLQRLRASEVTSRIPIIAISANATRADVESGLAAGFLDYLTKPLDVSQLLAAVQRALDGSDR